MSDTWVVNASPVIALAKVDQLHLLHDLCEELLIPEAVVAEIRAGPPSDPARRAVEGDEFARPNPLQYRVYSDA